MTLIVAIDDIKPEQAPTRVARGGPGITPGATFFRAVSDTPDAPSAYLVHYGPNVLSSAHYHVSDEFQIVVAGKGKFGRHAVEPYCVHFARGYTPYGPLTSDKDGMVFMTLRSRYDAGAERPIENLKYIRNRQPWQASRKVSFPDPGASIRLEQIPDIKDDQGLFACSVSMAANAQIAAPDPSGGDGQFVVVLTGSMVHENKEHRALTVVFVKPVEGAFDLRAGPLGLTGLILNLPRIQSGSAAPKLPSMGSKQ